MFAKGCSAPLLIRPNNFCFEFPRHIGHLLWIGAQRCHLEDQLRTVSALRSFAFHLTSAHRIGGSVSAMNTSAAQSTSSASLNHEKRRLLDRFVGRWLLHVLMSSSIAMGMFALLQMRNAIRTPRSYSALFMKAYLCMSFIECWIRRANPCRSGGRPIG